MVLYGITLVPLAEDLRDADPTLLSPFYYNYAAFYGSERRIMEQLRLLVHRGTYWGYFPKQAKSVFVADNPEDKEAGRQGFDQAGLNINYLDCS